MGTKSSHIICNYKILLLQEENRIAISPGIFPPNEERLLDFTASVNIPFSMTPFLACQIPGNFPLLPVF